MRSLIPLLVEPSMYFVIGFLLAALLSLPFMGAIHRRAARLTRDRLDSLVPMSVDELRAEKDLLRSEYAVATTRLQSTLEDVKAKSAAQRVEIGRHGTVVTTLKTALGEKARTIAALEAREAALKDRLRETEHAHASRSITLDDARRTLAGKEAELARLSTALGDRDLVTDHQSIELARTRVNVEALKATVAELNHEVDGLGARLAQARDDSETATRELAEERGKVENLGRRLADIEIELIAQRNEAEALSKVTAERICEQARILAAREYESDRLRVALDGAQRAEAALRNEFTRVEERRMLESRAGLDARAALEVEIEGLKQERRQLQWALRAARREAENSRANERVESALMRARIGEVSDQVASLRAMLPSTDPSHQAVGDTLARNGGGNGSNGHDVAPFAALDAGPLPAPAPAATPTPAAN